MHFSTCVFVHFTFTCVNIKTPVCQIIGPAAAGSAGPVPTPAELALWLLAAAKLVKVVIACDLLGFFPPVGGH